MLAHLSIQNYVLIDELSFHPSSQFNIITGETGAGKSIVLGALGLLLGNRADTKVLFSEDRKCVIEGEFDISSYQLQSFFEEEDIDYDHTCLLRREINKSGKSRAFINDTPVRLDVIKKLGNRLLDIHSQHQTLLLNTESFQTEILDTFASNQGLIDDYQEVYQAYNKVQREYNELLNTSHSAQKELDFNQFLLNELLSAELVDGELKALEEENEILENSETIKANLHNVSQALVQSEERAITNNLYESVRLLSEISNYSAEYENLHERLNSAVIEIEDIANEIERAENNTDFDYERHEFIKDRINILFQLTQKHHVNTVGELIAIQEELEEKVNKVLHFDEYLAKKEAELSEKLKIAEQKAEKLSEARQTVIPKIEKQIQKLLHELGMPNARLVIQREDCPLTAMGKDHISFLFSANKGMEPEELKSVASGGEFSRLMFSIKYILADKMAMPTIIFDEIDTGISGEISIKLGKMMRKMADNHQVMCITHQPQVAGQGDSHYFVYKDNSQERTVSSLRKLSQEERLKEIAQMIGGEKPSETALQNAKELLSIS
ncbi:MAG: DNA repair protein RecN [Cytophagales bacterium]|nr:DNA repair protein RecN [Cytophagales bacterium]